PDLGSRPPRGIHDGERRPGVEKTVLERDGLAVVLGRAVEPRPHDDVEARRAVSASERPLDEVTGARAPVAIDVPPDRTPRLTAACATPGVAHRGGLDLQRATFAFALVRLLDHRANVPRARWCAAHDGFRSRCRRECGESRTSGG